MQSIISKVEDAQRKHHIVPVRTGDTVRVSQRIDEGDKSRVQVFEGLVIRTRRMNSLSAVITVRRIASGVGVEKTFPLHNPTIEKVEVVKRSKTKRNYLSYMRERTGKKARLSAVQFDRAGINYVPDPTSEDLPEEAKEAIEAAKAEETEESSAAEQTDTKSNAKETKTKDSNKADSNKADSESEDKEESTDNSKEEESKTNSEKDADPADDKSEQASKKDTKDES